AFLPCDACNLTGIKRLTGECACPECGGLGVRRLEGLRPCTRGKGTGEVEPVPPEPRRRATVMARRGKHTAARGGRATGVHCADSEGTHLRSLVGDRQNKSD